MLKKSSTLINNKKKTDLKILTPGKILQVLPIALAMVQTSSKSENLLNKIRQIMHSLHQAKEITKKVNNNKSK